MNENNGGATRFSAFVSGFLVALLAALLSPYIQYIPKACLAAILCTAALRLIDVPQVLFCIKATSSDALVFVVTLFSCVFLSLSLAFYVGISLSIFLYLRKASTPSLEEFVYHETTEEFLPESEGKIVRHQHIRIVNVEGELFFGSTDLFQGTLRAIANDSSRPSVIIVRIKHVHDVDATTAIALRQLKSYLLQKNTHLIICSVPKQVISLLEKTDLLNYLGKDNIIALDEHHPKVSLQLAWKRAHVLLGTATQAPSEAMPIDLENPLFVEGVAKGSA
jgi:sulfate permease, SulP family